MAIIDYTYFIEHISLPTDNENTQNKLALFINDTQKKYLVKSLGYELYKLFIADLPVPVTDRFTDLLEGVDYIDTHGTHRRWNGLENTEKDTFLAYFAYYHALESGQYNATSNGVTVQVFENSELISPIAKQVYAYNEGVDRYNELYDFLYENKDTYPEWDSSEWIELKKINIFDI